MLIESANEAEEIAAARALSAFFTENSPYAVNQQEDSTEITLRGGVALSTYHAAICIHESLRTARLIKGVYHAIREILLRFPDQEIRVLYAGCGPYATLLFPVLPLFDNSSLKCSLLEINPLSVKHARAWSETLGLNKDKITFLEEDAIQYKSPETFHLLISETMFNALLREPQLRIAANLAPQLHPNGIMVPEEIRLDLAYCALGDEPYFDNQKDSSDGKPGTAEYSGPLFSLTKDFNFSEQVRSGSFRFNSTHFVFPEKLSKTKPDICIFTTLKTFGGHEIGLGESSLTNPYCVGNYYTLEGKPFRLVHRFEHIPDWKLEILS
ncbi:MAG: hypothetical protein K0R65_2242 [Crocinitomicaceae bacterium]|nr:hypothetical protein [Crocinitomicaceae bacterium]